MKTETMPTKTEFKFDCPTCGQHILVATDWVGLEMSCPSCQTKITIPSPPSLQSPATTATSSQPTQPTQPTIRIELPPKPEPAAAGRSSQPAGLNTGAAVEPINVTGHEPWPELVQHLERGALVAPAILATALFRELTRVRDRLAEVERKLASQHPPSDAKGIASSRE